MIFAHAGEGTYNYDVQVGDMSIKLSPGRYATFTPSGTGPWSISISPDDGGGTGWVGQVTSNECLLFAAGHAPAVTVVERSGSGSG